jgi:hypothetical protein
MYTATIIWFLAKEPKTHVGEKITSLKDGVRRTGHPPVDWKYIPGSHFVLVSIQSGLTILM